MLVGQEKWTEKMSNDEKKREGAVEKAGEGEMSVVQERLNWRQAQRDERRGAQGFSAGEETESMHELSDAGLLDEFFAFFAVFTHVPNPSPPFTSWFSTGCSPALWDWTLILLSKRQYYRL
jgi:hypothetical protein